MPKIPIYTAERGPGVFQPPNVPSPAPIESGGEALTEAGLRFLEIGQRLRAQQDDLDLYRTLTGTEAELGQWRLSMAADTDYETQGERFTKAANEIKYRKLETLRSPSVAAVYQARAERMIAEGGIHVQTDAMKKIVERQQVETVDLVDTSALRWAQADTPEKRTEVAQEVTDLVARSIFDPQDKHRILDRFDTKTKEHLSILVKERIENDASTEHQVLLSGRYDGLLDKNQVIELRNIAKRQIRENEEEARRVKAEQQEQSEMTLFESYRSGTLTSSGIAKSALPPHKQMFWENALENKQEKPYRESNLSMYANTLKTILSHPEKTTAESILAKMGKGLSIEHTTHALALWKKATESSSLAPAEYDPLRQALSIWEDMKKQYVFAPDTMLKDAADVRSGVSKPGPKLTLENDLASQKILDTLILRAEQGQEPRAVLKELMKPYVDREVQGLFSRALSGVTSFFSGEPSGEPALRTQAVEFLRQHNVTVTEESTKRTMDFLKKKGVK